MKLGGEHVACILTKVYQVSYYQLKEKQITQTMSNLYLLCLKIETKTSICKQQFKIADLLGALY